MGAGREERRSLIERAAGDWPGSAIGELDEVQQFERVGSPAGRTLAQLDLAQAVTGRAALSRCRSRMAGFAGPKVRL